MPLLELKTPRDMLNKALREHDRLTKDWDIDNLFNFFVTAYHVRDYILKTQAVAQSDLGDFLKDQDLKACRDLCNQGKHLKLSTHQDPQHSSMSGTFGGAPFGTVAFGSGTVWLVQTEDGTFDVRELADRVLAKWKD